MRRRFFVQQFVGNAATLRGEEAEHLGRVLRARPGQLYELSDGKTVWLGRVERVGRGEVAFSLVEPVPLQEAVLPVTLLLALVKFDRFEWCLEKAAELGVAEIVPLVAARSDVRLAAAAARRAARWQKILFAAAQQSRRVRPPALCAPAAPGEAFAAAGLPAPARASPRLAGGSDAASSLVPRSGKPLRLLLSERAGAPALRARLSGYRPGAVCLAVGPEGGWTDRELAQARAAGFAEASLGPQVLRTETAVVAALAVLHYVLGDEGLLV